MANVNDRVAVVFPGQGSQSVGMADDIVKRSPAAKDLFDRAAAILGYDLLNIIHTGPDTALQDTRISQPAIFVTNLAIYAAAALDVRPVGAAGHSFAEYCALTIAGAFTFEEALRLVDARAQVMGKAADRLPGAMSAVLGLDADVLRSIVVDVRKDDTQARVRLANFNAPTQIVISGDRRGVDEVGTRAAAAGAKRVVPLNVSGAWHSELMQPAQDEFVDVVMQAEIRMPTFPVVSNVDASVYASVEQIRKNLIRSVTDEVRWHDTALTLLELQPQLIVEFGGGRVLASLIKRLQNAPAVVHVGDCKGIVELQQALQGVLEEA